MIDKGKKILVVGLGLIGGGYAQGLTKAGYEVGTVTRSQSTLDFALENGFVAHGSISVEKDYVSQFDIIIFALYPHLLIEWITKYQSYLKKGALITDVTGVKGGVVYAVQEILSKDVEFVGAHPMAGKAVSGIQNADCNVFLGANYIVTPTGANTEEALQTCEELGRILGFGTITRISPEEHDEMIGFLSQLTHCIAVSLMTSNDSTNLVKFTGDSFRDLTRIADINEKMWPELFVLNKKALIGHIDNFVGQLQELRSAIETEDIEKMESMMILSTKRRKYFNR